MAKENLRDNL
jgi:hypothetical protein